MRYPEPLRGTLACLIEEDGGVFYLDAPADDLAAALFRYGRALTRIYDLTLHTRPSGATS